MILLVINPDTPSIDQVYFHANGQTLMQQAGENKYFYLHDRLGSIRQIINGSAAVVNSYTYDPWGNPFGSEISESIYNHFQFANYHWDSTVGMYYLNARWYDPVILRFTGRDPVRGEFQEPLTLHKYLYCLNNPINMTDPSGEFGGIAGQLMTNAIRGALMGALTGGMTREIMTQSWTGAAEGALFGGIGGAASGGLASFSAAGYIFSAIESSSAIQGMIAGGASGLAEGAIKREDLRMIFTRSMVGAVGGLAGGYMGQIEPPLSGIPGGVAGSEITGVFYEFFFSFFGGYPSLNE